MKMFIVRDNGTEDESVYVMGIPEDDSLENHVCFSENEEMLHLFGDKEEDVTKTTGKKDRVYFEVGDKVTFSELDEVLVENDKLWDTPKGGYAEIYPGPFDRIKEYCTGMCLCGKGSESCEVCPLKELQNGLNFTVIPIPGDKDGED
jgi:hypothetical protein